MRLYDYTGAIHFHSSYSFDGRVPVEDIIKAASNSEIDYLMITDHSTLGARKGGLEGWNGNVLLIVGQEISPRFNHYIAFGIDEELIVDENDTNCKPQELIDRVKMLGGLGFIAHPDHKGTQKFHVKQYAWLDWSVSGYTGIGIWDFMTDWQATLNSFPRALAGYLFPAYVLTGPRNITLRRWDCLNRKGRVVGIGELDNHETLRTILGLTVRIFPFKKAFRFIRTHLLLDSPLSGKAEEDTYALLKALEHGRAYVAMEYFHDARGFTIFLSDGKRAVTMGDDFFLEREAILKIRLPAKGKIRIIQDGDVVAEAVGKNLMYKISKTGVYRSEAYLKVWGLYRPWIFSNPIYVK